MTYATAVQDAGPEGKKRTWHYTANPETKKKVVQDGVGWRDESTNTYMDQCQRRSQLPTWIFFSCLLPLLLLRILLRSRPHLSLCTHRRQSSRPTLYWSP